MFNLIIPAAAAFLISIILIPVIIKVCEHYCLYDTVNSRKIHCGNIPRLGGIGISLSFFAGMVLFVVMNAGSGYSRQYPILAAGLIIFIFGVFDDIFELRAVYKLFVQLVAASIVVLCGYKFRGVFGITLNPFVGRLLTFFWIIGIINAYNLIDGMDGLCGSLSTISLVTYFILLRESFPFGASISLVLAAAVCGFLAYNLPLPNARIFMGDCGSQMLGFMISTIPLYSVNPEIEFNKFLLLLIVTSFPMLDTIAAIWRRLRDHYSIMTPDKYHVHHKLLNIGFNKRQALSIVVFVQLVICALVVVSCRFPTKQATITLSVTYAFMICVFGAIHYVNKAVTRRLLDRERNLRDSLKK